MAYDDDDGEVDLLSQPDAQVERELRQTGITTGITPRSAYTPSARAAPAMTGLPSRGSAADIMRARRAPSMSELGDPSEFKDLEVYSFNTPKHVEEPGAWSTLGTNMWQGTLGAWKDIIGGAEFASKEMGADPVVGNWLRSAANNRQKSIDDSISAMSPKQKDALSASWMALLGRNIDSDGNRIPTPGEVGWTNYFATNIGQMIPQLALALVPYSLAGKIAVKAASLLGVATKAKDVVTGVEGATRAANVLRNTAGIGTTGGVFGAQGAGELYNYTHEQLAKTPDAEMMQSEPYAELRKTMTEVQAKEEISRQLAPQMALMGVINAVTGVGITSLMTGKMAVAALKPWLRGSIGAAEGAALTGGQAGATTLAHQNVQQKTGQREGYDFGAAAADAVSMGLPGAAIGGVAGVLHRRRPPVDANPDVQPDHRAALEAAGVGGEETKPPAPSTPPAPPVFTQQGQGVLPGMSPQNEMFAGPEMGQAPVEPAIVGVQPGMSPDAQQGQLFDPNTQVTQPQPVQGEMFPRQPPVVETAQTPPIAATVEPAVAGQQELLPATPATPVDPTGIDATQPPAAVAAVTRSKGQAKATPPAAEAAVARSKGQTPEPAGPRPSEGMSRASLLDALMSLGINARSMSAADMARRFDREHARGNLGSTESPKVTTVVDPATSERLGQASSEEAAPPVPGISLPQEPEGAATGPTAKSPDGVRQEGGPAAGSERPAQATTAIATSQATGAARRAAAKAKLQGIVPDKTGPKPHVEAPTEGTRESANERANRIATEDQAREARRDSAVGQVQAALTRAVRAATGLKKGDEVVGLAPATKVAVRDLRERIAQTDGTDASVTQAVHEWAKAHPGQVPGTKTSWFAIGDAIHRDLTGKSFPEREAFAQEAGAMVEGQARAVESETQRRRSEKEESTTTREQDDARAEALVAGGDVPATSTGMTAQVDTTETRVAKGTSADVRGRQLVERALDTNDPMTALQADRDFGAQNQGRGRKRAEGNADLLTVARRMLAEATDEKRRDAIVRDIARLQKDEGMTPRQRENREKQLQADWASTDPARAEALRRLIRELEDPVKAGADARAQLEDRMRADTEGRAGIPEDAPVTRAEPDGINPRSSHYSQRANDPRMSAGFEHAMRTADVQGIVPTTRDLLRTVLQDTLLGKEMRPFRRLAQILLKHAPDLPVMSTDAAYQAGRIGRELYQSMHSRNVFGAFDPVSNTIIVNIDNPRTSSTHVETFLHEVMHSVTHNYLEALRRHDPRSRDYMLLDAMRIELRDHALALEKTMSHAEIQRVFGALKDVHELHTVMVTSPTAQAFAASVMGSPKFMAKLAAAGYPARPGASIWRSFTDWVRKALGMGPTRSASEQTFLDHILRPLTDITEHATEWNKQLLPKDPALRAWAEPLYDGINSSFRERGQAAILERADTARHGIGPALRKAMLTTMPGDRLVDRYASLAQEGETNHLRTVFSAVERAQVSTSRFLRDFKDKTTEVVRALKNNDPVTTLMNDVGYARAALGDVGPEANKHLTTDVEKAELARLQAQFRALSKEDQKLYTEARDLGTAKYLREREATANNLINRFMPDAPEAERAFMRRALSKADTLEAFLADPNHAAIAEERRVIARGIAKMHAQGFVQGDYFPMRRFGDWVVQYGEDASYGVQFFESRAKAEAFRRETMAGNPDLLVQSVRERNSIVEQRALPRVALVDEMLEAVRKNPALRDHAQELETLAATLQLKYASNTAKMNSRRKRIAGASKDVARAIEQDTMAAALRVGAMEHAGERDAAMRDLQYHSDSLAKRGGDSATLDQVIHELQRRFQLGDDAAHGGPNALASKLTSFGYGHSLMSFSRLATETAEMHLRMGAFIGARHGFGRASLELGRALKDISPRLWRQGGRNTLKAILGKPLSSVDYNLSGMARDRLLEQGYKPGVVNQFFTHFENNGLFDQTMAMQLKELARPSNMGKAWNWFIDATSAMSHASDESNRIAGAWAAYQLELKNGKSASDALRFAEDTLRKAPNYSPANRPRIASDRGVFGKFTAPIMQFKLYGLNEMHLLANLAHDVISRSTDPAVRKEAILALTGTIMAHSLMSGVLTWYEDPARYIGGAYDLLTGHKPKDRMLTARKWLSDTAGPTLGELLGRGVVRAAGMDVSQRMGVGNMFNVPDWDGTKAGLAKAAGEFALGASGENAQSLVSGINKVFHGDVLGGLKEGAPRLIRDPIKAYDLATKGVEDSRKKQILAPEKITPLDVAYQAVGFTPARVAEARAGRYAVMQARDAMREERTQLTTRWLEADPVDRAAVWAEIAQWNSDPHNMASRITRQQLLQTLHQRSKDENRPGAFGLRLPKKGARELIEAGSFANL